MHQKPCLFAHLLTALKLLAVIGQAITQKCAKNPKERLVKHVLLDAAGIVLKKDSGLFLLES